MANNVELKIRADNSLFISNLLLELNKIKEIKVIRETSSISVAGESTRGEEYLNLITILLTSFTLPSLISLIELYVTSRKIELEIEVPSKNVKFKISGKSSDDLNEKLSKLRAFFE